MMARHRRPKDTPKGITVILIGVLSLLISTLLLSFLFSLIAYSMQNPEAVLAVFATVSLMASAAVSGFITAKCDKKRGIFYAVLSSLFASLILIFIGLIIKGGEMSIFSTLNYAIATVISVLSAAIGKRQRKRRTI